MHADQYCAAEQAADGMSSDLSKCFHLLCGKFYFNVQFNLYMNCLYKINIGQ